MVQIEFFDPSGALEIRHQHAPRLSSLAGKRIGILNNEQWQSFRTLPLLKEIFERDHPGIEVLPVDRFPQGKLLCADATLKEVVDSGVDAVIIGNAA